LLWRVAPGPVFGMEWQTIATNSFAGTCFLRYDDSQGAIGFAPEGSRSSSGARVLVTDWMRANREDE
jgi:hypothetical protein